MWQRRIATSLYSFPSLALPRSGSEGISHPAANITKQSGPLALRRQLTPRDIITCCLKRPADTPQSLPLKKFLSTIGASYIFSRSSISQHCFDRRQTVPLFAIAYTTARPSIRSSASCVSSSWQVTWIALMNYPGH